MSASLTYWGCAKPAETAGGAPGSGGGPGGGKRGGGGDVPATMAKVLQKDVPLEVQVIGNVEAYATITVKAQVGGELVKAHFNEGDFVKKNETLFSIDPRPFDASLKQAEANLLRDQAAQGQAEANLGREMAQEKYLRGQADRYAQLFKEGVVSRDQAEQIRTNADAMAASVNADRAAIESTKAAVAAGRANIENVRVMLSYTTIRSPIDGRTGNLAVKQGNIVTANNMDMLTINQVQPIYVTFAVPEAHLNDVKKYMAMGKLQVMATPQEDKDAPEYGALTFVDNAVDATTGTIRLKGTFTNPARRLWPGQFVRVVLRLATQHGALIVPNQAVQTGQDGSYVYVVKADRSVEARTVTTGARVDQDLVITSGLEAGETVVTDGQLRLAPGMKVQQRQGGGGPGGKRGTGGPPQGGGPAASGEAPAGEGEKQGKRKSKE